MHRDRFIAARSKADARRKLRTMRTRACDAIQTVKAFPWIYTNAGCLAEAAAHWAFTAFPSLRVDDDNAAGNGLAQVQRTFGENEK